MPKRKLTKHEDDIRRGLRSPDSIPPYGKLRKSAENSPAQSPHAAIIQEQDEQIAALKRDVLEKTAELRRKAQGTVHDLNQIGGLQEENARLKAEVERLTDERCLRGECIKQSQTRISYLTNENARLKAECEARQAENGVLAVECDSLKAEVERLTKAGWQPIETAPKDGSSVIVYLSNALDTSWAQVAHWSDKENCWCEWDYDADQPLLGCEITHWMPYPEKPAKEGKDGR